MKGPQLEIRVLVLVLTAVTAMFALTTLVAHWYSGEQQDRARNAFLRGEELAQTKRHEQAVESFRNALAVSRSSTEYRMALARSLMELGQNSEAALHLQEVLRGDPAAALPNLLLARIAAREGRTGAAVDYYHRAIFGFWPADAQARRLAARWELVNLLAAAKQTKQVIAELISIADETPSNPEVQSRVAGMLIQYGSPSPAADILRSVIRAQPLNVEAWTMLGRAEMDLGNYQRARTSFRRALQYDPGYSPARQELSLVTEALSLDPTLRGLSGAQRLKRSQELASRALAAVDECARDRLLPPETADLIAQARATLARRQTDRARGVEINIALAEALWEQRGELCGGAGDEPVGRVLARLSR
ncbi:MAG TPA: tetratricopeptide repeat protein [Bryobacteraceae bacterium]|nr:tetratricopeptide repeat protein [Bryobacteraceae bacterium]